MRPLLLAAALATLSTGCADREPPPSSPAPEQAADRDSVTAVMAVGTALGVGDKAPDFALPDATGQTVRLSDLLERGPVVLTFYRGSWCPYCNTQLRDYQESIDRLARAGATLVAVSPQIPDSSMTIRQRQGLTFPVLSDVGNEVSREYGLVFQVDDATRQRYDAIGIDLEAFNGTDAWELPVPATYVIDSSGVIRFAFVEADYTQRASARQVVDALGNLATSGRSAGA